ncbi:hypothetical protein PR202_ga31200 [Eleusine coracana subsp. coracana]|uniref:Uncharacterized protein n=1 Tax=Eleusine coracana subsp. coracana TaxID=191504 RepID=A0AAV5DQE3_ELECO|nr:hypothetical protein PR202_ga31200 [Eleusine coracana subsp. coracana]
MDDQASRNGAWDIVLVRRSPSTARSDRCAKLVLLWFVATGVAVGLFVLTGYIWGSVGTVAILVVGGWFSYYYFNAAPPETPLLPVDQPHAIVNGGDAGLSQEDIDSIPAYEYIRKVPAEQCAVCINVLRDGETLTLPGRALASGLGQTATLRSASAQLAHAAEADTAA